MSDQTGNTSSGAGQSDNTSSQEANSGNPQAIVIRNIAREVGLPEVEYARFERFIHNNIAMRQDIIRHYFDPRRDLDQECGFPKFIKPEEFDAMYNRDPIAARAIEIMDREAWQVHPDITDKEGEEVTPWDQSFKDMVSGLMGRKSYFGEDVSSILWNYLKDACIKSKINRYAIVFYGFDDGGKLDQPVKRKEGMKLKYLRVFSELQAKIADVDKDQTSARFNQPIEYEISFAPTEYYGTGVTIVRPETQSEESQKVHYSRVLHVCMEDVLHMPLLQQIYNHLLGLQKLYAGSPEMYWRGAFPGLSIESDPALGGEMEDYDPVEMKTMIERYMNGLQRYLALNGFTAKSLAPQVVDPTPQINCLLKAIWVKLGVPQRVGEGTEEGKLASGQDKIAWNGRVGEYQTGYLTCRVVIPFVDDMINVGVLIEPSAPLSCKWPEIDILTPDERANIALKVAQAIGQYISTGGDAVITPLWFLTEVLGWEGKKAQQALDDMEKEQQKLLDMQAVSASLVPQVTQPQQQQMQLPNGQKPGQGTNPATPPATAPVATPPAIPANRINVTGHTRGIPGKKG